MHDGKVLSVIKLVSILSVSLFLASCSAALLDEGKDGSSVNNSDFPTALGLSNNFFDANKYGPNVATGNVFSWRGACHTSDGVPGGFHNAGDGMKFGLPAAFSFTTMGLAVLEYPNSFTSAQKTKQLAR